MLSIVKLACLRGTLASLLSEGGCNLYWTCKELIESLKAMFIKARAARLVPGSKITKYIHHLLSGHVIRGFFPIQAGNFISAIIIEHSRASLNLSWVGWSAVTKMLGTTSLRFQHLLDV